MYDFIKKIESFGVYVDNIDNENCSKYHNFDVTCNKKQCIKIKNLLKNFQKDNKSFNLKINYIILNN